MRGATIALWALWLSLSATATAQENEPPPGAAEYGLETDASSRYLFRGVAFSQEPVNQMTVWASFSGVSFYAFGNVLLQREPGQNDFNELDFGGSYAHELGRLTLEPAFDAYLFRVPAPRTAPHTVEGIPEGLLGSRTGRSLHPPDHRPAIQSAARTTPKPAFPSSERSRPASPSRAS